MSNYQSFIKRLEKCTEKPEVDNLINKMCKLYDLGLLTNSELERMDTKALHYMMKLEGAI